VSHFGGVLGRKDYNIVFNLKIREVADLKKRRPFWTYCYCKEKD